jgi:hypothetical protein
MRTIDTHNELNEQLQLYRQYRKDGTFLSDDEVTSQAFAMYKENFNAKVDEMIKDILDNSSNKVRLNKILKLINVSKQKIFNKGEVFLVNKIKDYVSKFFKDYEFILDNKLRSTIAKFNGDHSSNHKVKFGTLRYIKTESGLIYFVRDIASHTPKYYIPDESDKFETPSLPNIIVCFKSHILIRYKQRNIQEEQGSLDIILTLLRNEGETFLNSSLVDKYGNISLYLSSGLILGNYTLFTDTNTFFIRMNTYISRDMMDKQQLDDEYKTFSLHCWLIPIIFKDLFEHDLNFKQFICRVTHITNERFELMKKYFLSIYPTIESRIRKGLEKLTKE